MLRVANHMIRKRFFHQIYFSFSLAINRIKYARSYQRFVFGVPWACLAKVMFRFVERLKVDYQYDLLAIKYDE
jgi:hypothetical protein